MKELSACLYAEFLKIRRSKVFPGTFIAFSLAPIMGALFVIVLRSPDLMAGNGVLQAKANLTGFEPNWAGFLNLIAQALGVGGLIVFGFAASWVFGREYSDHTAKDLLVLPVSRFKIVISKMVTIFTWCFLLALVVSAMALLLGVLLSLDGWSIPLFISKFYVILVTFLLVVLLCTPVTFVASIGKGYLAPLAFVILMVVLAQIIGALGLGIYFPWAVPAIYTKMIGAQSALDSVSYIILLLTSFAGFLGTIFYWKFADQAK